MVLDARISDFAELLRDVERQRVVVVEDALDDPRFAARREVMKKLGVRGGMLAASYLGGKLQAILNIRQIGSPRRWTPEEITFAQSAAGVVSLLLLTRQHREALAALNLVTDSIFAEREDGRVIYANRPALELAGLPSRDLSVARVLSLSAHHFPHAGVPLEGSRDLHEIDWNNKTLEIHRSRLPGGGIISVIEDVTNRRAGQREREQLQQQLQQASRMEAIGQLAGGVAHDFNNLLGSISGFAGFLDQDIPKDTEQHHFVRRILSACERGKALVDQIMTFSRTRAIEQVAVDLRQVMQHSRELLSGAMPLSVRLSFDLGHGPVMVLGNEDQIGQIVANLCINARDALPDRSGDISVQLANVFPGAPDYRRTFLVGTLNPNRRYARIDVRDSGAGIAPEHLSRIFEPFFTTKERGHGTGLGLAIVHGIIVSYEGACAVESALGQGTCFSIYLPVIERPALSQPIETKAEDARGRERILVIDDEVDITDVLSIGLERLGYEVGALNDSLEAFDAFTEDPNAWDVVVTDHSMPGLTGLEIAEKIKALRPDVAVILCTGLDDGVLRPAAQKAGIDGFLVKPTTPERIAGLVRGLRRSGHRTVAGS
jgi:signal transduction histidine kinase/ActR/RegA family two-component response regulator